MFLSSYRIRKFVFLGNGDDGEFVQWGDSVHSVDTAVLKRNNIKYKIENDKVYIPEKSFDKAIYVLLVRMCTT